MTTANILYIPHGGGPLPLLGDANHRALTQFLQTIPNQFPEPEAIIVFSAHWETDEIAITGQQAPSLIYDYYGFPDESYQIQYPAPGHPALAERIAELVSGFTQCNIDAQRGFDHGIFVPLKLMYPKANIPCVQISLQKQLDPQFHISLGECLTPLQSENLLIIGSGMSYHNLSNFFRNEEKLNAESESFNQWLNDVCISKSTSFEEKTDQLVAWKSAPGAIGCHPREEHLMPLHACFGAAKSLASRNVFNGSLWEKSISSFLWQ